MEVEGGDDGMQVVARARFVHRQTDPDRAHETAGEAGEEAIPFLSYERADIVDLDGQIQPELLRPLIILLVGELVGIDGVVLEHVDGFVLFEIYASAKDREVVLRPFFILVGEHLSPGAGERGEGEEKAILLEGDEYQVGVGDHGVALEEGAFPWRGP